MRGIYTADAQQAALGFLISQTSYIEPQVLQIRYPDIQYQALIPVDTSAPEWAKSVTFFSSDMIGQAEWFNHMAKDVPLADVTREKFEQGIQMAAIGYRYTLEELGQAMMVPGTNLPTDRAAAARRAYDEFVDNVAMRGNTEKNWTGLINDAGITVITVDADGNNNSTAWDDKDPDQILRDINAALTGVYTESNTVEMADTLLLPVAALASLGTRRLTETSLTLFEFVTRNNVYTMVTGAPLTIRAVRRLETAGSDGGGRMIAYRRDPQVLKLHIPMTHRFLPVWQTGPITFDVPGIFRLGGLEIRRPGAMRYVDGIMAAPYE